MLGLLWHEIDLDSDDHNGTTMMTKLQLSKSTLGTITAATATTVYSQVRCFHVIHYIYTAKTKGLV